MYIKKTLKEIFVKWFYKGVVKKKPKKKTTSTVKVKRKDIKKGERRNEVVIDI